MQNPFIKVRCIISLPNIEVDRILGILALLRLHVIS